MDSCTAVQQFAGCKIFPFCQPHNLKYCRLKFHSMPMRHNTHSPLLLDLHSTRLFQPSKPYMLWGATQERRNNTSHSLNAAMAKLNKYYERTAASDAHIIVISACIYLSIFHILIIVPVLDPTSKLEYFKKHWSSELLEEVKSTVKAMVCSCVFLFLYNKMILHIVY